MRALQASAGELVVAPRRADTEQDENLHVLASPRNGCRL